MDLMNLIFTGTATVMADQGVFLLAAGRVLGSAPDAVYLLLYGPEGTHGAAPLLCRFGDPADLRTLGLALLEAAEGVPSDPAPLPEDCTRPGRQAPEERK